jgi:hypothetical protein
MKILAIEKELEGVDWENQEETLRKEAHQVYQLYLSDNLREIYFTHENNAVLVLECESLEAAKKILEALPLVQKQMIDFQIMQLKPYTGYERILK